MIQLLPYPFKVWITSVLCGSALYVLWLQFFEASNHTVLNGIYPLAFILAVVGSGLLSVPAFLLLWFGYCFTVKKSFTKLGTKFILVMLSLILAFLTVRMVPGVDNVELWSSDNLDLMMCYWLGLLAGIFIHKLDRSLLNVRRWSEK